MKSYLFSLSRVAHVTMTTTTRIKILLPTGLLYLTRKF